MTFQIVYTTRAERDIGEILGWLNQHSSRGALIWLDRMEAAIASLREMADRCTFAAEHFSGQFDNRSSRLDEANPAEFCSAFEATRSSFGIFVVPVRICCHWMLLRSSRNSGSISLQQSDSRANLPPPQPREQ